MNCDLLKNSVVMDFGCNTGQACIKASQAGAKKVIGVEGMPDTFKAANDIKDIVGIKDIEYFQADFNDKDFDKQIDRAYEEKADYSFFFSDN